MKHQIKSTREAIISGKVTKEEAELIKQASEKEFMNISSYVRKCAVKSAKEILEVGE